MKINPVHTMAIGLVASVMTGLCARPALAWDAHGHKTITLLAIDQFEAKASSGDREAMLAFVFAPSGRAQAGYQAGEPDRYRAIRYGPLKHENDPDHYIDIEDLAQFGLTLSTIPPLRYEYLRDMAVAKHEHPENVKPYNPKTDTARTQEWPGFLPYAIEEHYGKLISSFRQIRVLGALNDPARADQLAAARANVIYEMGYLAHVVGDAAQPLHTTAHHHGWVGDNPSGFTTNRGVHAYIDTTVLGIHNLGYDTLKGKCTITRTVDKNDPWPQILEHIQRSFDQVRPLYTLQKSGDLDREPGRAFITERLCDGAGMLSALYAAAWEASAGTDKDVKDFIIYDQASPAEPNPMKEREKKPAEGETGASKTPSGAEPSAKP